MVQGIGAIGLIAGFASRSTPETQLLPTCVIATPGRASSRLFLPFKNKGIGVELANGVNASITTVETGIEWIYNNLTLTTCRRQVGNVTLDYIEIDASGDAVNAYFDVDVVCNSSCPVDAMFGAHNDEVIIGRRLMPLLHGEASLPRLSRTAKDQTESLTPSVVPTQSPTTLSFAPTTLSELSIISATKLSS